MEKRTTEEKIIAELEKQLAELRARVALKEKVLSLLEEALSVAGEELRNALQALQEMNVKLTINQEGKVIITEITQNTPPATTPVSTTTRRGTQVKIVFPDGREVLANSANEASRQIADFLLSHYTDEISKSYAYRLLGHANQRENLKRFKEFFKNNYKIVIEIE